MHDSLLKVSKIRLFLGILRYMFWKAHFIVKHYNVAKTNFQDPFFTSFEFLFRLNLFRVKFINGRILKSHNIYEIYNKLGAKDTVFKFDYVTIKHSDKGACEEVFSGAYDWLEVKDKTIIDIGANIGDSSIYFAINGAKRVYGYEVNPRLAEIANLNVKDNRLDNTVEIKNEGMGNHSIKIERDDNVNGEYQAKGSDDGITVQLHSLRDIFLELKCEKVSLKIDCEGCEYFTILDSDCDTLNRIEQIIGEYHYDYLPLKAKLESCGFKTEFTKPTYFYEPDRENKYCLMGVFKAWKIN